MTSPDRRCLVLACAISWIEAPPVAPRPPDALLRGRVGFVNECECAQVRRAIWRAVKTRRY